MLSERPPITRSVDTLFPAALGLSPCRALPVVRAAGLLRVAAKRLWTRIAHFFTTSRALDLVAHATGRPLSRRCRGAAVGWR